MERQFTIIKELLSNDQKIGMLNEDEKRSLAFLKDQGRKSSLGTSGLLSESSVALSPSEVSLDPSEEDVSILRDGKKWKRNHTFFNKTTLKSELCQVCNKAVKFGKTCLKCRDCRTVCHPECKDKAALPCVPCVPTPNKKKMHEADLASFCPQCVPRVPAIVVHCVHEIERRALADVGIYRVPGSDKMVKELKERLLKAKGNPSFLESVQDINVVCGVLKDFLRGLREPLLTFRMHNAFMQAAESDTEENGLASTLEAIAELPPANKDTLAFIILHLQKVASYSESNKMPTASLAKVFGPTIVVQRLMGISGDYWKQLLVSCGTIPTPVPSPIGTIHPVPESPFLGSCQSPRMPMKTPVSAPWSASKPKRAGTFFAPPN
eukprot:Em0004g1678a